jgi:hypothetical protein
MSLTVELDDTLYKLSTTSNENAMLQDRLGKLEEHSNTNEREFNKMLQVKTARERELEQQLHIFR